VPYAPVNGINLYYEVHGTGPAIVLAHGALSNRLSWWQQVPALSARTSCIVFDHRGFGASVEAPGGSGFDAFPDDLLGLLDHLGIRKAVLLGQSMGGWTVLELAVRHPERVAGLILADTTACIADPVLLERQRLRRLEPNFPPDMRDRTFAPGFLQAEPELSFLFYQTQSLNPPRPKDYVAGYFEGRVDPKKLPGSAIPTLFIVGEHDIGTPPEIIRLAARNLPHARIAEIKGAGHCAYFENAAEFNRIVVDFMNGVRA
jgi:3-oxoadipate enol-lactonase